MRIIKHAALCGFIASMFLVVIAIVNMNSTYAASKHCAITRNCLANHQYNGYKTSSNFLNGSDNTDGYTIASGCDKYLTTCSNTSSTSSTAKNQTSTKQQQSGNTGTSQEDTNDTDENQAKQNNTGPYYKDPYAVDKTLQNTRTEHAAYVSLTNPAIKATVQSNGDYSVTCFVSNCNGNLTVLHNPSGIYLAYSINGDVVTLLLLQTGKNNYKIDSTNPYTITIHHNGNIDVTVF